jgi:hypothetical protein
MRGNRQHWHLIAMAVVQAIDQMQIAWPATACTHRQRTGDSRFSTGGKRRDLLMAGMHPAEGTQFFQAIGQAIEAIAGHPPDAFDTGIGKGGGEVIGNRSGHAVFLVWILENAAWMSGARPLIDTPRSQQFSAMCGRGASMR